MQTASACPGGARRNRFAAAVGVVAAILPALLLALAAPAAAHSRLVATTPAGDSVVATAPGEITLTFNESVSSRYTHVAVTGADGASVINGATMVEGATVRQPLMALAGGRYTVSYQAVSEDGHPVGGTFTFTVAGRASSRGGAAGSASAAAGGGPAPGVGAATATTTPGAGIAAVPGGSASTAPAADAHDGGGGDGGGVGGALFVVITAVVVLVVGGLLVFLILRRRQPGAR
ncbi:copper resistance CopC family protein [Frankia sp. AvcI1]|uniref:copper resistance CopC family protein n=1 Tax=Frankia sp. AvcI1 TaxID=573496 RepID=UPI0006EC077C|nr:copper resistance CopC family protein [Frankia sp. AvcI1]